jgi:DNA adenine methylase
MLFKKFSDSVLIVSYSSNSQPTLDEMVGLISAHKNHVDVVAIDHRYSFGNQGHKVDDNNNGVKEYIFVGY